MSNETPDSDQAARLRKSAEDIAADNAERMMENVEAMPPDETKRLLHELRVHQIELEMQNEELRRVQEELEASRARYFDLYDLAPVGYITISEKGLILEANLTAAGLLGVTRKGIVRQPVSGFIAREDQDVYYLRRKQLLETKEPQAYELRMLRKDGSRFWTQIETTAAEDMDGEPLLRAVLSDITDKKAVQSNLAEMELRHLSRKMILAWEKERKRLSREIHDSIGQKIISIQLEIEWLKNRKSENVDKDIYKNMLKLTVEASDELQNICMGLRPMALDRIGFIAAIRDLLSKYETHSDVMIRTRIMPVDETRISPDIAINIYRILQESLTNAARHSKTKTAFVSLRQEGSELMLDVRDEGCGLAEDESSRKFNFGILGMRERANMSGGSLEIDSKPGKGTEIRLKVPMGDPGDEEAGP